MCPCVNATKLEMSADLGALPISKTTSSSGICTKDSSPAIEMP